MALLISLSPHLSISSSPKATISNVPYTFVAIGDWGREGQHSQRKVAKALSSVIPDHTASVISVGDNFYDDGVANTEDPLFNRSFEHVYHHSNVRHLPWHLVLGNHDYHGDVDSQLMYSTTSARWNMPARYYSRTLAPNLIGLFLDTNPIADDSLLKPSDRGIATDIPLQMSWLKTTLQHAPSNSRFLIIMHHNTYTMNSKKNYGVKPLREAIDSILAPYTRQVAAVINGHEHVLMHMQPFGAPGKTSNGIDYFTTGAGSERSKLHISSSRHKQAELYKCCSVLPLTDDETKPRGVWGESTHGFFVFSVGDDSFEARAYNRHGKQIYSYDKKLPPLRAL